MNLSLLELAGSYSGLFWESHNPEPQRSFKELCIGPSRSILPTYFLKELGGRGK